MISTESEYVLVSSIVQVKTGLSLPIPNESMSRSNGKIDIRVSVILSQDGFEMMESFFPIIIS